MLLFKCIQKSIDIFSKITISILIELESHIPTIISISIINGSGCGTVSIAVIDGMVQYR